ncbi:hypothetical protein P7248_23975 [Vibrio parahaemolyticus]|nr:hypothetical protein [Vibrio parahaemolyticus]
MKKLVTTSIIVISICANSKEVAETKWVVNQQGDPAILAKNGVRAMATYLPSIGVISFYDRTRACKNSDILGNSVWKINETNIRMLSHCAYGYVSFAAISDAGNKFVINEFSKKTEVNTPIATYSTSGFLKAINESKIPKVTEQFDDQFLEYHQKTEKKH